MRRLLVLTLLALAVSLASHPAAEVAQSELVIVREGTKEYHRPGCEVIRDGKAVLAMTRAQAEGRKFTSHENCDPAKQRPTDPATGKPSARPPAEIDVFVDGGRQYHKEDCKRLGKESKKMTLEQAGRKLWPCPECKPPIRPRPR
jgi:hypothetical protein